MEISELELWRCCTLRVKKTKKMTSGGMIVPVATSHKPNRTVSIAPFMFSEQPRSPISGDVACNLLAADTFMRRARGFVTRTGESVCYAQACMHESADAKQCVEAF